MLDAAFGFLVWAVHFLAIYCANALACARGIGQATAWSVLSFKAVLVALTVVAIVVVAVHAGRRASTMTGDGFLSRIAIGGDVLAIFAMAIQLLPILVLHLCL